MLDIYGVGRTITSIRFSNLYRSNIEGRCDDCAANTVDWVYVAESFLIDKHVMSDSGIYSLLNAQEQYFLPLHCLQVVKISRH